MTSDNAYPSDGGNPRALLSVVVPCCDEEAVIGETHRRLVATLQSVPELDFELVYVDDGSRDATLNLLRELQHADTRVRVLALSRNFGHEIAITAGLQYAAGDAVVLIDADLQDPPEVIPEMLERWRRGADVAYGLRTEREGETRFKRWTAGAFYRLLDRLADISIPLDTGSFRLMDRKVVDAFLAMPERDRFARAMVAWTGFRQEPVPYRRAARAAGETKYPFGKMLRLAIDGILSFSLAPLRLATWLGFLASGLALAGHRLCPRPSPPYRRLGLRLGVAPRRRAVPRRRTAHMPRHPGCVSGAHLRRGEAPSALSGEGTAGVPVHQPAGGAGRACG